MDTRDIYKLVRELSEERDDVINLYDSMDIELSEGFVIETGVVGFMEDGVIVHLDEDAMEFLDFNGVLLESEEVVKESYDDSPVYNAVLNRITRQHLDLLSKFGPAAVMAAVEDVASSVGDDLDEIGSSDVSIWTKQVVQDLEAGNYKHLHEGDAKVDVDAELAEISKSDDPFELVYRYISGDGGEEMRKVMQDMYDDIVIDFGLHPDDDFEKIIDKMLDYIDADSVMKENEPLDELNEIKRLAHGSTTDCPECNGDGGHDKLTSRGGYHTVPCKKCSGSGKVDDEEVTEGFGKVFLGAAGVLAALMALLQIDKNQAEHLMKTEPQLIKLAQMHQEAVKQGDMYKAKELEDRIEKTADHISVTGRPVMGPDGEPIVPGEPIGEAEYQGRKVPLGKPMQGDVKKSKVYVKKPNGKVVKVNFGDKNMKIKKSNPARRKSFRARHNCDNPGPRWKARYWSCRAW